ncbi:hypothetical protein SOVF_197370, partial [Spinacia oleracea]
MCKDYQSDHKFTLTTYTTSSIDGRRHLGTVLMRK